MTYLEFVQYIPVPFMLIFVALLFGDLAMGAARAARDGEFRLQRVGDVFMDKAVPYGITMLVLALIKAAANFYTNAEDELFMVEVSTWANWAFTITWAGIALSLLGSIAENVGTITGKDVSFPDVELPEPPQQG